MLRPRKFKLGDVLRDKICSFEGVVMSITDYLTGCTHYGLCARALHEGKEQKWQWFDEGRLTFVEKSPLAEPEPLQGTSGPCQNAPQM